MFEYSGTPMSYSSEHTLRYLTCLLATLAIRAIRTVLAALTTPLPILEGMAQTVSPSVGASSAIKNVCHAGKAPAGVVNGDESPPARGQATGERAALG